MPSDRDVEHQLRAFGATLAGRAGEPIRPVGAAAPAIAGTPSRRRWALLGAVACVAALVAGFAVFGRADRPEPADQPAPGAASDDSGLGPLEALMGVGVVVEATVTGTRGPVAELGAFGAVDYVGRSEDADEWTTPSGLPVLVVGEIEIVAAIGGSDAADAIVTQAERAVGVGSAEVLAPLGVYAVGERYQLWLSRFSDFDGFMSYLAFDDAGAPVAGLGRPDLESSIAALTAHTGDTVVASLAALAREMNVRAAGGRQGPLMDVVFGPAVPEQSAAEPVVTSSAGPGEVPTRPITDPELAALDADDRGLVCDANGIGAAEWDFGPISEDDERGRRPVDAFRDALAELSDDARRDGASVPPAAGWTELVVSDSQSYFVLESGGVRQAVVSVSGDPVLGVWRHGSADLCQSLFLPDGYVPPTDVTVVTAPPPVRQPAATTAPGAVPLTVEAYPAGSGDLPPIVAADDPVFVLVVSNQSFEDDPIGLVITIDGQLVADDEYDVGSQHTISTYHVRGLAPGGHDVVVASSTGVGRDARVRMPDSGPRWAYVTYWYHPDDTRGRYVDLTQFDEPVVID